MTRRTDGGSLAKYLTHYWVKPWTEPETFWRNEALHAAQIVLDPLGHASGHLKAAAGALEDGRPLDAGVALLNDMWEPASHQSEVAKRLYGIPSKIEED